MNQNTTPEAREVVAFVYADDMVELTTKEYGQGYFCTPDAFQQFCPTGYLSRELLAEALKPFVFGGQRYAAADAILALTADAAGEREAINLAEVDAVIAEMIKVATEPDEEGWLPVDQGDVDVWQARLQIAVGHRNGFPSRPSALASTTENVGGADMVSVDTVAAVQDAAKAWLAFKTARSLMNAAIPATNATPAERNLYAERRIADAVAEKEHHRTAIRLAQRSAELHVALSASSPQANPAGGGEETPVVGDRHCWLRHRAGGWLTIGIQRDRKWCTLGGFHGWWTDEEIKAEYDFVSTIVAPVAERRSEPQGDIGCARRIVASARYEEGGPFYVEVMEGRLDHEEVEFTLAGMRAARSSEPQGDVTLARELDTYASHEPGCSIHGGHGALIIRGIPVCDCGLDELRAKLHPAEPCAEEGGA